MCDLWTTVDADSLQLVEELFNPVEADFLKKLVNELLVFRRYVGIAIAQEVKNVPEVGSIPINKIPAIFILLNEVSTTEHCCQHAVRVFAKSF